MLLFWYKTGKAFTRYELSMDEVQDVQTKVLSSSKEWSFSANGKFGAVSGFIKTGLSHHQKS